MKLQFRGRLSDNPTVDPGCLIRSYKRDGVIGIIVDV